MDVFLSHAAEEQELAERVCRVRSGNIARNTVMPMSATTAGRWRRIFRRSVRRPAAYSCRLSVSMPGVGTPG